MVRLEAVNQCTNCNGKGVSNTQTMRALMCSNGAIQYKLQCNECGTSASNPVKREQLAGIEVEPWNHDIAIRVYNERVNAHETKMAEMRAHYSAYLKSPEWARKRAMVMRRASNTCEGCATNRAVQVHHKTYEHVGEEFLWELVAVCVECHERLHGLDDDKVAVLASHYAYKRAIEAHRPKA